MKLADKISLSRILMAPLFFVLYYFPFRTGFFLKESVWILIPLLAVIELTDFFDGYYARKLHEVSDFGKLFDPFADVMAHLTAFICFVVSGYMPVTIFLVIFFREFSMLFLRLMCIRNGIVVGASMGGKTKTVIYIVAIVWSLLQESFLRITGYPALGVCRYVGYGLYLLGMIASLISFGDYVTKYLKAQRS